LREFETTFIVQPEISDEACTDLCGRLDAILDGKGARRVMLDDWGKRKLAYEIQRFQKGHYFVLYYLDEGSAVPEIERLLRLEESVLRFLTVRAKDRVADVDARVAEGIEQERIQREKAAERAAREAEAERQAREAAAAAATAGAAAAAADEPTPDEAGEDDGEDEAATSEDLGDASDESAGEDEEIQE
jgi:small subunit ribosomal protein S6